MSDVRWNALMGLQNPGMQFQAGAELGRQRQMEEEQLRFRQEQMEQQRADRQASVRAGKHVAAGDMAGARTQAAASGNLDLVGAISRLSAEQRAQVAEQAQVLAPIYHGLRQMPYEHRRAQLQRVAPQLAARGIPPEMIAGYDPTDQNLDNDMRLGMTLEQAMQQGAIDWQIIPQVGAFATDAQGYPVDPSTGQRRSGPGAAIGQPPTMAQQPAQPGAQPTAANGYAQGVGTALAAAGLPAPVIAGILGNGEHESGGQWNQAVGDGGTAHGAFQWRNDRVANFQQVTGVHPSQASPDQTAAFVLWELQNPERAGMTREQVQAILSARTPEEAAVLFSRHYERPNAALAHNDRRVALANRYGGQQPAPTQFAQGAAPQMPGQQASLQDQAATGVIMAPPRIPEGMMQQPDGSLAPRPGSQQEFERRRASQGDAREGRREYSSILNNFNSDPEVRKFREARIATMQINNLGQSGSPSDDVALIFSFMRALDPGSTVREGEFATAQNTAGVAERVRATYNQLLQGTRLTPAQRNEFMRTAERMYLDRARSYNEIANNFRLQLRAAGMPEDQIGPLIQTAEGPQRQDRERARQRGSTRGSVQVGASSGQPQQPPRIRVIRRRPAQ